MSLQHQHAGTNPGPLKSETGASLSLIKRRERGARRRRQNSRERGFTLIEITIAMVIMMVVCLGAASLFSYAAYYVSGGNDRTQALAVAQQALESLRHCKYSKTFTDPLLAATAAPTVSTVYRGADPADPASTGRAYQLQVMITDVASPLGASTLKSITVSVTPLGAGMRWATSGGTVTIQTLRAQTGDY
jgi:prepilin-type N-terminal cleavage/methylation domain-containing protein